MISKLENPFAPDQSGNTIIHTAIDQGLKWGSMEIFKLLASMVEDPNAPNANGDTPLKIAFQMKNRRMFKIILEIVNKWKIKDFFYSRNEPKLDSFEN